MATARRALWGAGTQTAGLAFGGYIGTPPTIISAATEEYGGASWTNGGALTTAGYHLSGTGTQTAGLAFARGTPTPGIGGRVEEYDGSSWSEQNNLGTARYVASGFGIQTAAACVGGAPVSIGIPNMQKTEEYDGANWSDGGTYPTPVYAAGGCGSLTAGLLCGGYSPPAGLSGDLSLTCEYDGSSWTAVNSTLYAVNNGFASGTQTDAVLCGGSPSGISNQSQVYDGTNWSASAGLAKSTYSPGGSSLSGSAALSFGGGNHSGPANSNATEEFTGGTSAVTASTLTTS